MLGTALAAVSYFSGLAALTCSAMALTCRPAAPALPRTSYAIALIVPGRIHRTGICSRAARPLVNARGAGGSSAHASAYPAPTQVDLAHAPGFNNATPKDDLRLRTHASPPPATERGRASMGRKYSPTPSVCVPHSPAAPPSLPSPQSPGALPAASPVSQAPRALAGAVPARGNSGM